MSLSASFLFQGGSVSDPFPAASEGEVGPAVERTEGQEERAAQQREAVSSLSLGAFKHLMGRGRYFLAYTNAWFLDEMVLAPTLTLLSLRTV